MSSASRSTPEASRCSRPTRALRASARSRRSPSGIRTPSCSGSTRTATSTHRTPPTPATWAAWCSPRRAGSGTAAMARGWIRPRSSSSVGGTSIRPRASCSQMPASRCCLLPRAPLSGCSNSSTAGRSGSTSTGTYSNPAISLLRTRWMRDCVRMRSRRCSRRSPSSRCAVSSSPNSRQATRTSLST